MFNGRVYCIGPLLVQRFPDLLHCLLKLLKKYIYEVFCIENSDIVFALCSFLPNIIISFTLYLLIKTIFIIGIINKMHRYEEKSRVYFYYMAITRKNSAFFCKGRDRRVLML